MSAVTEGEGPFGSSLWVVKRAESGNAREQCCYLHAVPQPWSVLDSSKDGICSFGVAGSGTSLPELWKGEERTAISGPFSAILRGFNSLSLSSVWFRKDLPAWNNLSFCLPYAGYVTPGDPRHNLLLANENDSSF